MMLSCY